MLKSIRLHTKKIIMKSLSAADSDSSLSGDEFPEDLKLDNDQSIKQALRREAKVSKLEKVLNGDGSDDIEDQFRNLKAKDNLEILISLIARPHEIDCRVKWAEIMESELNDPLITRDLFKKQNVDVNKSVTLKNIYRSYKALSFLKQMMSQP